MRRTTIFCIRVAVLITVVVGLGCGEQEFPKDHGASKRAAALARWQVEHGSTKQRLAAIGELRRRKTGVSALVHALLSDKDEHVSIAAADALAMIGGNDAADGLSRALKTDSRKTVRYAAASYLGQLKNPRAWSTLINAALSPVSLPHQRNSVATAAQVALEQLSDKRTVPALIKRWGQEQTTEAQADRIANILYSFQSQPIEALNAALANPNARVRYWALHTLLATGSAERKKVEGLLSDKNERVRDEAKKVLAQLGK